MTGATELTEAAQLGSPGIVRSSDGLGAGTDLYFRALAFNDDDTERKALMAKVWRDTPWMVDAYTGSHDTDRRHNLMKWCREQFGPEAWPIHGHAGQWHSGGATVDGWTWMGFATEDQMRRFMERWPAPNAALTGAEGVRVEGTVMQQTEERDGTRTMEL